MADVRKPFHGDDARRHVRAHASHGVESQALVSRRHFLLGALSLGATAVIGGAVAVSQKTSKSAEIDLAGSSSSASTSVGDLSILNVPQDAVFTTEDCEFMEDASQSISMVTKASLPFGTLIWANDDHVAACLLPCDSSDPLTEAGILSLDSGSLNRVLTQPIGADEGFQIYDVRANSAGMVWVESNILRGDWRIYTAPLIDRERGEAVLVAEGNSKWEVPAITVAGAHAYWQEIPAESGPRAKENSSLLRAPLAATADSSESEVIYSCPGRMACAPSPSATGVTIAPRTGSSGSYYQLTHIDDETGEVTDKLVLPNGMRPTEVAYGDTGFSFSFDSIYSYGDGIANLGTYTPAAPIAYDIASATKDVEDTLLEGKRDPDEGLTEQDEEEAAEKSTQTVADLYSASEWFRFPRTPFTTPSWCGDLFMVKSTNVVAGIDLANRRYFSLDTDSATQDYGEFLASCGTTDRFVTYANVDYAPIDGEHVNECTVRVWERV